jgi:hypothetical protein
MNGLSRHHLIPKARGGKKNDGILMLEVEQHKAWHALFGNRTIGEVIAILEIINREKRRKRILYLS